MLLSGDAPAWQRNALFQFFASLRLAMVLLGVLIVASIAGTIYESSFDARIAGAYIYRAAWFNLWLLMLALNLIGSALSRMPWRRHHTGFLITHLGIIILLAGSYLGRTWGVEGTMTLFKSEPPRNLLTVEERVLQIAENENSGQVVPFEMIHRRPAPGHPRHLATTASGWDLQAIDYSDKLNVRTEAQAIAAGSPAIHLQLSTAMMGQKPESWLVADDTHGTFDLGLASVRFQKGVAPNIREPTAQATDIEESIFVFANSPADQVARSTKGGSTGAKVRLMDVAKGTTGKVVVQLKGKEQTFELDKNLGQTLPLADSNYSLVIDRYWPDFRIKDGNPESVSEEPNNPCVLVTLRGHAVPLQAKEEPEAGGKNYVTVYYDETGTLTYELSSRKTGITHGILEVGKPLPTGWADWQLLLDQVLPSAGMRMVVAPALEGKVEGALVRATKGTERVEQWVPFGWQVPLETASRPLLVGYGFRQLPLPISLQLTEFEVERNEGSDAPAGFKSTVTITSRNGSRAAGQCWMNNPISYPSSWLHTFSGLTYKISQASWNPENLSQSTVQILRDPGWGLKWIGSLLVVSGIFSLFYLRPAAMDVQLAATLSTPTNHPQKPAREAVEV